MNHAPAEHAARAAATTATPPAPRLTTIQTMSLIQNARRNRLSAEALHVRRAEDRWRIAREQEFERSGWFRPALWERMADSPFTIALVYFAVVLILLGVALGWINP